MAILSMWLYTLSTRCCCCSSATLAFISSISVPTMDTFKEDILGSVPRSQRDEENDRKDQTRECKKHSQRL